MAQNFTKDMQYYKFCMYGFLKDLRFFEPFLILFFIEKGFTFLQIGTLYAVREILINIMEIPTGVVADAVGRRRSLILSFFFYILSFVIFFISKRYPVFIAAMLFYAIGDAFRTGTHKAMIFEYLKIKGWKDQRVHYYGHTRSWSQAGAAVSALVAGVVVFYSGSYQYIFLYSTVPYLLDLFLVWSYPKALDGNIGPVQFKGLKKRTVDVTREFISSFGNIHVIKAIANLSVHSGFHKAIKDYLQPVLQTFAFTLPILVGIADKQRAALIIGIIYFVVYILTSFAARKAGATTDKLKSTPKALNVTMILGYVMAVGSGLLFHYSFFILSIVLYIGIYIVENLRNPIGVAYVSELYKQDILATALSANSQAKSLMAAIIAPVLGFLADTFGVGIGLAVLAFALIITAPVYLARKNYEP
ncbi:MAG: MFS transporter [Bacteroidetes bacterium GWC2_33_15]|nr:MAG: MFS transporter [Bacteroidetes bacterium GWA2_33_15]OFX50926.1 MAG: MFS transporter [Bacteroidetes bacterium GWC2_33_15]OFX66569.1 MAG: MFS transporter [Bacteroidetes bacterium GWB2_32_14]OFX70152.1 MAG: MFS transporter [Bacteroidetes bacterium GWD2_33_33]HAN20037.1 MFS transporter [Bacteroidales bacterium]